MKKLLRRLSSALLALSLVVTASFALTVDQARTLLEEYYVDEIPQEVLELETIDEILEALGDPYTDYYTAAEYQSFFSSVSGTTLVGIGIVTPQTADDNGLLIISVIQGGPADTAGIKPGDRILEIDGTAVNTETNFSNLIAGRAGTDVTLKLLKVDSGKTETVTLSRQYIVIPLVTYKYEDDIALITYDTFGIEADVTLREIMLKFQDLDTAWVMDLRNNPGGFSDVATNSASWFVGNEKSLISYRGGDGEYSSLRGYYRNSDLTDRPVIVMTDGNSASASEMFVGAIRDLDAGISVGQRTYGKGIAQIILDASAYPSLFNGDAMKITVYTFYSPDGTSNHVVGVLPALTISVENTEAVAKLLAAESAKGEIKITLANQDFYVDMDGVDTDKERAALTELLEALPPSAALSYQENGQWTAYTPADMAAKLGLSFTARGFGDTADSFADSAITTLAAHGLLSGYTDGTFRPAGSLTRAELCAMLANALNLTDSSFLSTSGQPFSDVAEGDWYAGAVQSAYAFGLVAGYDDGTFRPDAQVTVQELTAILANAARKVSIDGYELHKAAPSGSQLAEYSEFSSWAQNSAWILDELGALNLHQAPTESASRASAAQLIYSFMSATGMMWE